MFGEKNVVYQATVTPKYNYTKIENYVALCLTKKDRFLNNKNPSKHWKRANETMFNSRIWDLKKQKIDFEKGWRNSEKDKLFLLFAKYLIYVQRKIQA